MIGDFESSIWHPQIVCLLKILDIWSKLELSIFNPPNPLAKSCCTNHSKTKNFLKSNEKLLNNPIFVTD